MKANILLLIFSLFPLAAQAQVNDLPNPEPYFVAIIVENMDSSVQWYTKKLGFEVISRIDLEERGFKQANLKLGNTRIELIQTSNSIYKKDILKEATPRSRIAGLFKFGFVLDDFDKWVSTLKNSGVEFKGSVVKDPNTNQRMVIILDPDGNRIQLFEK